MPHILQRQTDPDSSMCPHGPVCPSLDHAVSGGRQTWRVLPLLHTDSPYKDHNRLQPLSEDPNPSQLSEQLCLGRQKRVLLKCQQKLFLYQENVCTALRIGLH